MKKYSFSAILILLLNFISVTGLSQVQEAWVNYNVGDFFDDTGQPALILDRDGNVILGINTRVPDYGTDLYGDELSTFHLSKFRPDGSLVFEILEGASTNADRWLVDIAVDNAGNIYCAVQVYGVVDRVNAIRASTFNVYKYSPTGTVLWKRSYTDGQYSSPQAIAVDPAGNVFLTGFCIVSGAQVTDELPDYLTVKWNSGGTFQWARRYDGASPGEGYNQARAIAVDGSGNVYITGQSQLNGVLGYATLKYNAAGTQLWAVRYEGLSSANDNALAIARDVSGFIYVTGRSDGATVNEGSIATIKYNNDGAQIWVQREGSSGGNGRVIRVDGSGNVFVGGNSNSTQMVLLKINFAGTKQWAFTRSGRGLDIDIDGYGNSYIAGTSNADGVLIKLNSGGTQQWINTYNSPGNPGIVNPIEISALESIYLLNFLWKSCSGCGTPRYEAKLIKYTQCDIICPQDMTINTSPGLCTGVVNYNVDIRGECGSNIAYSQPTGTALPVGTTIVAVVDITTGEYCTFNVTVRDAERPQARCKNITIPLGATGSVTITAAQVDNGSSDNCGIQSLSLDRTFFNCSNVGTNNVVLTVTDVNGNTSSCTAIVTIQDNTPPVVRTKNITVNLNAVGTVSITSANVDNGSSDECGTPSLSIDRSTFTCDDKGSNDVILTATDPNGNTASATAIVTVVDNIPPTITSVSSNPTSLWPSDRKMHPVTISTLFFDNCPGTSWRVTDVAIKSGMFENDNLNPDSEITGLNTVNLRAEIPKRGIKRVYMVTVTATDASGNTSTSSVDVAVSLNITTPRSGFTVMVGSTVNLGGEFWDVAGRQHTAKWLIDNNTSVKATLKEPTAYANGTVAGSFKFNSPGVYKLQMNVTDQYGITSYANTAENLDAIVVVYDPNGGYTFGGGSFYSPAGALKTIPNLAGDVSYGFTVNYYKGAITPKGETQFNFKLGDFEFNALNFDYLSISGARAQFKGTGRIIGGQSGISFIMTVIDGKLDGSGADKIRMKIFNKNNSYVYFDNEDNLSDADDPKTTVNINSSINVSGNARAKMVSPDVTMSGRSLQITASPNPTNSNFIVRVTGKIQEKITVQVIDIIGRIIETRTVTHGQTITIGELYKSGTYIIRAFQEKEESQIKVIKKTK